MNLSRSYDAKLPLRHMNCMEIYIHTPAPFYYEDYGVTVINMGVIVIDFFHSLAIRQDMDYFRVKSGIFVQVTNRDISRHVL